MRGEIFNELLEFAAESVGSGGTLALTTREGRCVGRYDGARHYDLDELVHLVDQLATARGESRATVLSHFGAHLFRYFAALYPTFLTQASSAIGLLASIDTYVHGELRKLYPDAEFPAFECRPVPPAGLAMTYRSARPLADLAEGLIRGCIEHFGEPVGFAREELPGTPGTVARFVLTPGGPLTRTSAGQSAPR
jgi:hypothetical protein